MKLYYMSGACSIGIHVILEEIGKPYDAIPVALREGEQYKPEYKAITPKSKVPALMRDDGSVLTEYGTIARWLAKSNPQAKLLPEDLETETRMSEALDYAVGTVHMQGFSRLYQPGSFTPNEADFDTVRARGREIAANGYALLDKALAGKDYIAGAYSIGDSALFYVGLWGGFMGVTLPANLAAHQKRMLSRPAVQRVLKAEGLDQAKA